VNKNALLKSIKKALIYSGRSGNQNDGFKSFFISISDDNNSLLFSSEDELTSKKSLISISIDEMEGVASEPIRLNGKYSAKPIEAIDGEEIKIMWKNKMGPIYFCSPTTLDKSTFMAPVAY
jgi:DNA polymerase III sliding clamp (beta) subunit (PCNA family)